MLQIKKIRKDLVAVSFSPTEIMLRSSGKQYYGKEKMLAHLVGDTLIVDESVAREFGLVIKITKEETA